MTHLTNIFASARLLVAGVTSSLLLGFLLAPTASSSTNDRFLNRNETPLAGPRRVITSFDAPDAGTNPGQGTLPYAINPAGMVTGFYVVPAGNAS
jgi:hypothetical protein